MKRLLLETFIKLVEKFTNQQTWEKVHLLSLEKMNFGNGGDFYHSGELFVARYIQKKLAKESNIIIFDVGANVGDYANALIKIFTENSKIYSFEPSKKAYALFLEKNRNIDNIVPNNFGFSDIEHSPSLFTNFEGSGLASVYQRKLDHIDIAMDKSEQIQLTTIDNYCVKNRIDRINFLKLDIEGHEFSALKGGMNMIINKKIDFIQFEFGGTNIDSRTYFQDFYYFLKDNYNLYRILKDGIFELTRYKETYEIFSAINYLAVKK